MELLLMKIETIEYLYFRRTDRIVGLLGDDAEWKIDVIGFDKN